MNGIAAKNCFRIFADSNTSLANVAVSANTALTHLVFFSYTKCL